MVGSGADRDGQTPEAALQMPILPKPAQNTEHNVLYVVETGTRRAGEPAAADIIPPMNRSRVITIAVGLLLALGIGAALYGYWWLQHTTWEEITSCESGGKTYPKAQREYTADLKEVPGFYSCLREYNADVGLMYQEAKDLAKSFLTLLVTVLAGSLVFSEKIVSWSTAGKLPKTSMLFCWFLLLLSIVACGSGLICFTFDYGMEGPSNVAVFTGRDATVAGMSIGYPAINPTFVNAGVLFGLLSGLTFCLALCAMIIAVLSSLHEATTKQNVESPNVTNALATTPATPV